MQPESVKWVLLRQSFPILRPCMSYTLPSAFAKATAGQASFVALTQNSSTSRIQVQKNGEAAGLAVCCRMEKHLPDGALAACAINFFSENPRDEEHPDSLGDCHVMRVVDDRALRRIAAGLGGIGALPSERRQSAV